MQTRWSWWWWWCVCVCFFATSFTRITFPLQLLFYCLSVSTHKQLNVSFDLCIGHFEIAMHTFCMSFAFLRLKVIQWWKNANGIHEFSFGWWQFFFALTQNMYKKAAEWWQYVKLYESPPEIKTNECKRRKNYKTKTANRTKRLNKVFFSLFGCQSRFSLAVFFFLFEEKKLLKNKIKQTELS